MNFEFYGGPETPGHEPLTPSALLVRPSTQTNKVQNQSKRN
jgi:hypothetical protein